MLFSLQRPLFSFLHPACPRSSLRRLYSTSVSPLSTQKWNISGIAKPYSILDDDDAPVDLSEDDDAANGVRPNQPPLHKRKPPREPTPTEYKAHRRVMKQSFPDGWQPPRKLSREAMEGLRDLHRFQPQTFTTSVLADKFKISPEAVRRILKSKWAPPREKTAKLALRERLQKELMIRQRRQEEFSQSQELRSLEQGHVRQGVKGKAFGAHSKDRLELV